MWKAAFAVLMLNLACSPRASHSPGPHPPERVEVPEAMEAKGERSIAFEHYRAILDVYTLGPDMNLGQFAADMPRVVGGLVRLGRSHPPASEELERTKHRLSREVLSSPEPVPVTKIKILAEICSSTSTEVDCVKVLRELAHRGNERKATRAALLEALLPSLQKAQFRTDVLQHRDVLWERIAFNQKAVDLYRRRSAIDAALLYEALLANGEIDAARKVSDAVLGVYPGESEARDILIEAATRAGSKDEAARLGGERPSP